MARVLVIEGHAGVRDLLARVLSLAGHEVAKASDAREGLRVFGESPPMPPAGLRPCSVRYEPTRHTSRRLVIPALGCPSRMEGEAGASQMSI